MFAILKINLSQYCVVIQRSLMFSVMFVSNFCSMVKLFLYIIGLHWAALRFLAVAPLFCVARWSRGMDVRCSSSCSLTKLGSSVRMVTGLQAVWPGILGPTSVRSKDFLFPQLQQRR